MATTVTIYRLCVDGDMENRTDYRKMGWPWTFLLPRKFTYHLRLVSYVK